jgi:membrane protein implicated in regulation of membrane protease activity
VGSLFTQEVQVAEPDRTDRGRQLPTGVIVAVAILVLAPIVALLWVGSYAKAEPRLWGFPFFYWYQLMWVFIASACTYMAYMLIRNARRGGGER